MTDSNEGVPDIEPLELFEWFDRARVLLDKLNAIDPDSGIESALRRAFHFAQLTPHPLRDLVSPSISEADYEILLDNGAYVSAALALIGARVGYQLMRSINSDDVEATVCFSTDQSDAIPSTSECAATAILGSWHRGLNALWQPASDQSGSKGRFAPHLVLHKFQP